MTTSFCDVSKLRRRGQLGASVGVSLGAALPLLAGGAFNVMGPLASESVDVAICGLALNDVAAVDQALHELGRVVRPGGQIVYSVVHPRGGDLGWSRTFESDDGPRSIVTHWHTRAALERGCARAQLVVDTVVEPRLPTGMANPPDGPVALIVRAIKAR